MDDHEDTIYRDMPVIAGLSQPIFLAHASDKYGISGHVLRLVYILDVGERTYEDRDSDVLLIEHASGVHHTMN